MKPHSILQSHANALFSMHSRVYKSFDLNDVGDEQTIENALSQTDSITQEACIGFVLTSECQN